MLTISLILLPLITSIVLFFIRNRNIVRTLSLLVSVITLLTGIYALINFGHQSSIDGLFNAVWVPAIGIRLSFGMDGLSLVLMLLTVTLVPMILFTMPKGKAVSPVAFHALILMMEAALIGVFTSQDILLFYIFWELTLIPIYFICGLWGGENRIRITLKFFIYTMLGSLFMLLAIIWLYLKTPDPHTFSINTLVHLDLPLNEQLGIFAAFFLAFAIKIPIFPFHSWQPDTYTVAPTAGSMLLAGLMAKMGLYGFIRILLPVCKPMVVMLSPYLIPLALTGLIYGSIIAIRQKEIKRLIAYSSFAHVGLMAAVLFTLNIDAWQGSVYQMLSHGFNVIALFFIADIIQNRTNTTKIADLGGIAKSAPRFAIFFMIVMLGSIAMPLTNGFIGEFMMLWGLAQYNILATSIAGLSIILGAVYMFWLYQKTMYGDTNNLTLEFKDLNTNELFVAVPLVIMIILMGVYPKPVFDLIKPALDTILSSI